MISIIIPTYNDDRRLNQCLKKIIKQTAYSQIDKIIIVNNSENDVNITFKDKKFLLIKETTPGSYAARNAGVKLCTSEYVAFTDSDCLPDEKWIEVGLQFLQNGNSRVAGNIIVPFDPSKCISSYDHLFSFPQAQYCKNGYATTANLLLKRSLFDTVGRFNQNLLSGGDEEWNLRATHMSIDLCFSDSAIILHPPRENLKELIAKERRLATNGANRYSKFHLYLLLFATAIIPPIWLLFRIGNHRKKAENILLRHILMALCIHYFLRFVRLFYLTLYLLVNFKKTQN